MPFFPIASCAARTQLACMNSCMTESNALSAGIWVPVTDHCRGAGMSRVAKIAAYVMPAPVPPPCTQIG